MGKISLSQYLQQEMVGARWMAEQERVWQLIGMQPMGDGVLGDCWEGDVRRSVYDDLDTGGYGEQEII